MKKAIINKNKYLMGHPWIFEGTVLSYQPNEPEKAEIIHVYDNSKNFIGTGFYNKNSDIRIRLFSKEKLEKIDKEFLLRLFTEAFLYREKIFGKNIKDLSCRIFYSESDGFSGLTIDKYNNNLVIQITSLLAYNYLQLIKKCLIDILTPEIISIRTEEKINRLEGIEYKGEIIFNNNIKKSSCEFNTKNLRSEPKDKENEKDEKNNEENKEIFTIIEENGIKYKINLTKSQKTGFYFDQAQNRIKTARYAEGKNVLDLFCYTGGFGFNCIKAGAKHVLGLDSSREAINLANENKKLNNFQNIEFLQSDYFDFARKEIEKGNKYNLIILDPPKMTHSSKKIKEAIKGYIDINFLAFKLLEKNSFLITSSCTGRVSLQNFIDAVMTAAQKAGRVAKIIDIGFQGQDHPILLSARETHYLKCLYLYVE